MRQWFTSDTHFGHEKIIQYTKRPFASAEEMDETIITRWNEVVQPEDRVWHLGDFFFCSKDRALEIRRRLNGRIDLVIGNHDRWTRSAYLKLDIRSLKEPVRLDRHGALGPLALSHHPPRNPELLPTVHLAGHVHEKWRSKVGNCSLVINVGVDQWDFRPVTFTELGL